VAGVLVLLSIALITIYFRESSGGGLHQVQSGGATVLRPFEIAADRVSRPFRDAYGYFAGLVHAKSENNRLRAENDRLRQQETLNLTAASENADLRAKLHFVNSPRYPGGYDFVTAPIIVRPQAAYAQQVTINAGSSS
jgi:rod shape-determining protein MreC